MNDTEIQNLLKFFKDNKLYKNFIDFIKRLAKYISDLFKNFIDICKGIYKKLIKAKWLKKLYDLHKKLLKCNSCKILKNPPKNYDPHSCKIKNYSSPKLNSKRYEVKARSRLKK